jgi:hypothetical protein
MSIVAFWVGLPRWARFAIAGVGALLLLFGTVKLAGAWHDRQIARIAADARMAGRQEQAALDTEAFVEAQRIAAEQQAETVAAAAARGEQIGRKSADDIARKNDRIAAAADRLRKLWPAPAAGKADPGGAGQGAAAAVPGAADGAGAAACAAGGWVSLPTAIDLAAAADREAARADGLLNWIEQQAAAWPK